MDNYRGISLTCVIAKMVNSVILTGFKMPLILTWQTIKMSSERRSTVGRILAQRKFIEEVKKNNLTAYSVSLTSKRLLIQFTEQ